MSLERHPSLDERFDPAVRIVEHDPGWADRARAELDRIAAQLGPAAVRLEHVGSTAVPGLAAKPILDLQVSVESLAPLDGHADALSRLGYLIAPDPDFPGYPFFAKPPERPRAFHLHLCASGGDGELRHLAVRDFLRAHEEEAVRYAALKRELATRTPQDRLAYMAGKAAYMDALERRAVASERAERRLSRP